MLLLSSPLKHLLEELELRLRSRDKQQKPKSKPQYDFHGVAIL
jgi:hypothetical protein